NQTPPTPESSESPTPKNTPEVPQNQTPPTPESSESPTPKNTPEVPQNQASPTSVEPSSNPKSSPNTKLDGAVAPPARRK
ncbi:energy transducer TonB, partial [Crocosphaera sp. Alani8]